MTEKWYMTAPDLSVTFTEDETVEACMTFDQINWDEFEARLPPGAKDTEGRPIDRNNRHVRLAFLAEATVIVRKGVPGSGLALMDNEYFRFAINAMLDAVDKYGPGR